MALNIAVVKETVHQPRIMVVGVGGGGGNAVENMIRAKLGGATFAVANTDLQVLERHPAEVKIQLGKQLTEGLGAGANPSIGTAAAEESYEEICEAIRGSHMVFVTCGMGGGTGTGAAPVVARAAREMGILTVAVVTKPFSFEGTRRMKQAEAGIAEMQDVADTVIVIPNQNLFRVATERTTLQDAFKMADDVLYKGVRGVTDLMLVPGIINLDFNDVKTVMSEMGQAMMGTGESEGERRAILAAEMAISSPLLDGISMQGAKGVLINITGGDDLTLYEVDEAANRIREEVDPEANIIFGTAYDASVTGRIRVSVVATGLGEVRSKKANMVDLSALKTTKHEAQTPREEAPKAEVRDFAQALATKQREREEEADEYANLEIPAFLRRQAN
ncbi:MAG: cell division protein FtsZ [Proteobacteria bacterium]|nr:cell division protein FtsZ [Pseudomonadota bacterium]NBX86126.1 cell division protein FtsZ [Pseudomonadota bacterium]